MVRLTTFMNRFRLKAILLALLLTSAYHARASFQLQVNERLQNDTLENITRVALNTSPTKLFVHYDKNIYLPGETIWFTAYRPCSSNTRSGPDVIAVALMKNTGRTIIARKKFVVTGIASSGYMLVPDSVPAGDYTLIAYTNHFVDGRPDELFAQRIFVKQL